MSEGIRRGLVLGGGGTLGAAWMIGAMTALHEELGFDPRTADMIVGTSAGAILAALLGAGASAQDLWLHQHSAIVPDGPLAGRIFDYDHAAGGGVLLRPAVGIGSPKLIAATMRHPRRYPKTVMFSAFLPTGRGSLGDIGQMVEDVIPSGSWSTHAGVRIVAMDYDSGDRVVFGDRSAPQTSLAEAVMASCRSRAGSRRPSSRGAGTSTAAPSPTPASTCSSPTGCPAASRWTRSTSSPPAPRAATTGRAAPSASSNAHTGIGPPGSCCSRPSRSGKAAPGSSWCAPARKTSKSSART